MNYTEIEKSVLFLTPLVWFLLNTVPIILTVFAETKPHTQSLTPKDSLVQFDSVRVMLEAKGASDFNDNKIFQEDFCQVETRD